METKTSSAAKLALFIFSGFFLLISFHVDAAEKLWGEAFSNTETVVKMPEGWADKPIVPDSTAEKADLSITLDQHLYPALLPLIKKFAAEENIKISVKEGTCGISAGMLARRQVDIGGFCCPPGSADRLPGLKFHTLGIASIAILVNKKNPIDNLSENEVRDIFQGKIFNWNELKNSKGEKGPNIQIRTIGRLHCKARPGHWRLILDNEDLFSPRMIEVGSIADMMSQIEKDEGAVGYEVLWNIHRHGKEGSVAALKINGIDPGDMDALKKFKYPFYRAYNVTTWINGKAKNPFALRFIKYIKKNIDTIDPQHKISAASDLVAEGWRFTEEELAGTPIPGKIK